MLTIPAKDTHKQVYIKTSQNLSRLKQIRNKITTHKHTQKELEQIKQKYKRKARHPTVDKYITRYTLQDGSYHYYISHEKKNYGTYHSLEEAQRMRDKLVSLNWDTSSVKLPIKRRNTCKADRYIHQDCYGNYCIKKLVLEDDGVNRYVLFDSGIKSLCEARRLRDWWESVDWDLNVIDTI